MASIRDRNVCEQFDSSLENIRNKLLHQAVGDVLNGSVAELYQEHRQNMKSLQDTCLKKCTEDEAMFEKIGAYKQDIKEKTVVLKERRSEHLSLMSDIEDKELDKGLLIQKIDQQKEDMDRIRDRVLSEHKANKDRLKTLNQSKDIFQKHLGLEVRKVQGEKLQFIFRNITHKDPDLIHTFLLKLDAENVCHIESCDPHLKKMPEFERRLQETNNFGAFLVNVRREFVALHFAANTE